MAAKKVVTEAKIGKRGKIYWLYTPQEINNYNADMKPYNQNLSELMQKFPADKLYMHPIKLSKWRV